MGTRAVFIGGRRLFPAVVPVAWCYVAGFGVDY